MSMPEEQAASETQTPCRYIYGIDDCGAAPEDHHERTESCSFSNCRQRHHEFQAQDAKDARIAELERERDAALARVKLRGHLLENAKYSEHVFVCSEFRKQLKKGCSQLCEAITEELKGQS